MDQQQLTLPTDYIESLLLIINVLEVLPELTEGITNDINEGESYEVLVRRLKVLCAQIIVLSERAIQVKTALLPNGS